MSHNIYPFIDENVNPASYDLRVGCEWIDVSIKPYKQFTRNSVTLYPYSSGSVIYSKLWRLFPKLLTPRPTRILATTIEKICIPADMCAMVKLKTTPTREGLGHPIADWVDPGFIGKLTLMLHAFSPITLHNGQRICQIVFSRMSLPALVPYSVHGHYMNQDSPTLSWRENL